MDYPGPKDDMIIFALSAGLRGLKLYVDNRHHYGVLMLPLEEGQDLERDTTNLLHTLLEATVKGPVIEVLPEFKPLLKPLPQKSKLGFDKIFMVNLERRPDRHQRMKYNFDQLGIDYEWVPAMDGRTIDEALLAKEGIAMLPDFSEPYHGRPLTYGEIGCFLSHYRLWQKVVDQDLDQVLIFEDDIKFEPFFVSKLEHLKQELTELGERWDLVFLGRKILHNSEEPWVKGSQQLVRVDYTYWTLAYLLTRYYSWYSCSSIPLSTTQTRGRDLAGGQPPGQDGSCGRVPAHHVRKVSTSRPTHCLRIHFSV